MLNTVLYERLEDELDDMAVQTALINAGLKGKFMFKPNLLDIDIVVHMVDLFRQCDDAGRVVVDAVTEQIGEPGVHFTGSLIFFHLN